MQEYMYVAYLFKFDEHPKFLDKFIVFWASYLCVPCTLPNAPRALSAPRQFQFYTVDGLPVRHALWVHHASLCVHRALPNSL